MSCKHNTQIMHVCTGWHSVFRGTICRDSELCRSARKSTAYDIADGPQVIGYDCQPATDALRSVVCFERRPLYSQLSMQCIFTVLSILVILQGVEACLMQRTFLCALPRLQQTCKCLQVPAWRLALVDQVVNGTRCTDACIFLRTCSVRAQHAQTCFTNSSTCKLAAKGH